jgi:hypothetical protein
MASSLTLVAGRYRLLRQLGAGGMGRVWLAQDEMLRRHVAVKEVVIPHGLSERERGETRYRTLREARTAARLNHPSVIKIYDVVHTEEQPWIVMEYVPSRSLQEVITETGPVRPAEAARIGLAVLDALTAAHAAGVLHRDVKPGNVLLARDGRVVLTDFGLATFDGGESAVTLPGLVFGSVRYVAPERARDGTATPESDLWALGATLFAAVEGRSPYARDSAMATLTALATEVPDAPKRAGPLKPALTGLLKRNPRDRLRPPEVRKLLLRAAAPDRATVRGRLVPRARLRAASDPSGSDTPVLGLGRGPGGSDTPVLPIDAANAPTVALRPDGERADPPGYEAPVSASGASPAPVSPAGAGPHTWRGRTRHRTLVVGAVGAALVLAGTLGAVASAGRDRPAPPPPSAASAAASASLAPPDPVLGAGACPATGATEPHPASRQPDWPQLLPGWAWYRDPTGYRLAVPEGWLAYGGPAGRCFREPGDTRWLGVMTWSGADPVAHVTAREQGVLAASPAPSGYHRLGIRPLDYYRGAAEWEFTFQLPSGVRMHGQARDFLVAPGRGYTIVWCTRDFDWQPNLDNSRVVMASFAVLG